MKKEIFKKVIYWEKKPKWDGIIGGIIFTGTAIWMIHYLSLIDYSTVLLTILFTLMFVYGCRSIYKSLGEGKKEIYLKVTSKKKKKWKIIK